MGNKICGEQFSSEKGNAGTGSIADPKLTTDPSFQTVPDSFQDQDPVLFCSEKKKNWPKVPNVCWSGSKTVGICIMNTWRAPACVSRRWGDGTSEHCCPVHCGNRPARSGRKVAILGCARRKVLPSDSLTLDSLFFAEKLFISVLNTWRRFFMFI